MNPFFQRRWSDTHSRLISYFADALSESLPPDLSSRSEEQIFLAETGEEKRSFRADVAVVEPWRSGWPPVAAFGPGAEDGATLEVAEPLLFTGSLAPERWLEIRDTGGGLITVIEILSPFNKRDTGLSAYRDRQYHFLSAGVHLVEIDLIRGGTHAVAVDADLLEPPPGTCHLVCTTRMLGAGESRFEVYFCPLREPLPTIRVPLRRGEPDVPLALQPPVDRCYRTGRYWLSPADARALRPPAANEAETVWIEERLREAGLK